MRTRWLLLATMLALTAGCGDPLAEPDRAPDEDAEQAEPDERDDPDALDERDDPDAPDERDAPEDGRVDEPDAGGDPLGRDDEVGEDGEIADHLADEVRMAIDLAARDADVTADDVEVVTVESVTWPDGALGCPEPGEMYTQALVEGYRIVLDVDGEEVHVHGAVGEEPFRCDDPQAPTEDGGVTS